MENIIKNECWSRAQDFLESTQDLEKRDYLSDDYVDLINYRYNLNRKNIRKIIPSSYDYTIEIKSKDLENQEVLSLMAYAESRKLKRTHKHMVKEFKALIEKINQGEDKTSNSNEILSNLDETMTRFLEKKKYKIGDFSIQVNQGERFNNFISKIERLANKNRELSKDISDDIASMVNHIHDINTVLSMVKQRHSSTQKGHMVISVDPAEILTMSDNTYGWTSCVSPFSGAYANSPMGWIQTGRAFIVYVHSKRSSSYAPKNSSGVISHSKMWRRMGIFTDDGNILLYKPYPFKSNEFDKILKQYIEEQTGFIEANSQYDYEVDDLDTAYYKDSSDFIFIVNPEKYPAESVIEDSITDEHDTICPSCGGYHEEIDSPYCQRCRHVFTCDFCDDVHHVIDKEYIEKENAYVCLDCYEDYEYWDEEA